MSSRKRGSVLGNTGLYVATGIAAFLFLIPFYLIVRNALMTDQEITGENWKWFPTSIQWSNISELFDDPTVDFARSLWNSTVVAVLSTSGILLVCSLAGYGLARIPYKHANKVFYVVLATLMVPTAVTFVPSFVLVSSLGWVDSYRGLIVPGLFSGFTCFLFRQYFLGFPKELEEAARVDGLGYWGAYWRVVVPNSLNFFAAMATITFINGWNSFLWPLVIGQDPSSWTVQVALSSYMTNQTVNYHLIFMATAVSILPLVFVFLFLQRWLVQGIAQTGIKG
ncbi:carbohydrate ABC transporter permease [Streptomyces acidiscabies]|uniref:Carbohydrate ABC transporter permease n=1 Tax=Streptomyces acidiscabies TaxID=42234 RepID=A0A0L0K4D8_9ACTN|nr:carbohydrate ABC transporter permease [Streptomyces acidiscabies]MBP5936096.1 carbohydrate ABC transporter permease [Streptomyces sp. LBUM 1476]KND32972.1 sugar ABC transporter permease [Streptomyces acidiscabies]MBZ3915974.1 carbohydrate ABC transporter permease [Streptomyces acidiscabies]MDX2960365.1 carbohydrate ABC transporter permease [Streptomyces acidiscabies]MDX3023789.1 carbohydrate ABC transporter permease [Streptomyces acidiscabies]